MKTSFIIINQRPREVTNINDHEETFAFEFYRDQYTLWGLKETLTKKARIDFRISNLNNKVINSNLLEGKINGKDSIQNIFDKLKAKTRKKTLKIIRGDKLVKLNPGIEA